MTNEQKLASLVFDIQSILDNGVAPFNQGPEEHLDRVWEMLQASSHLWSPVLETLSETDQHFDAWRTRGDAR